MPHKVMFAFLVSSFLSVGYVTCASAESKGTWSCKLDGQEWKNEQGGASLNAGTLTLYSGDDRIDGIYIMTSKPPAVGNFELNESAQASFSDTKGTNFKSKAGGKLAISQYAGPSDEAPGKVTGTFSSTFAGVGSKQYSLTECAFSLPVKNL